MAYVVTEPCFGCKYTDCVVVCPCDCFHEGEQMLFIDPEHCTRMRCVCSRVSGQGDLLRRQRARTLARLHRAQCGDGRERARPLSSERSIWRGVFDRHLVAI